VLFAGGVVLAAFTYRAVGLRLEFLMEPILYIAMAGFCAWSIRNGRDRFQPVRIGGVAL